MANCLFLVHWFLLHGTLHCLLLIAHWLLLCLQVLSYSSTSPEINSSFSYLCVLGAWHIWRAQPTQPQRESFPLVTWFTCWLKYLRKQLGYSKYNVSQKSEFFQLPGNTVFSIGEKMGVYTTDESVTIQIIIYLTYIIGFNMSGLCSQIRGVIFLVGGCLTAA